MLQIDVILVNVIQPNFGKAPNLPEYMSKNYDVSNLDAKCQDR